jgi:hypothetical protein
VVHEELHRVVGDHLDQAEKQGPNPTASGFTNTTPGLQQATAFFEIE